MINDVIIRCQVDPYWGVGIAAYSFLHSPWCVTDSSRLTAWWGGGENVPLSSFCSGFAGSKFLETLNANAPNVWRHPLVSLCAKTKANKQKQRQSRLRQRLRKQNKLLDHGKLGRLMFTFFSPVCPSPLLCSMPLHRVLGSQQLQTSPGLLSLPNPPWLPSMRTWKPQKNPEALFQDHKGMSHS